MASIHTQLSKASDLIREGDCGSAAALLREAVREAPDNATVRTALGNVLSALGRHEEAVGHHLRAIETSPVCHNAFIGLAMTCLARGDKEQGRALLSRADEVLRTTNADELPSTDELIDEYVAAQSLPDPMRTAIMARLRALARRRTSTMGA